MNDDKSRAKTSSSQPLTWRRRLIRTSRRIGKVLLAGVLFYVGAIVIGLIPVNNGFKPTADGIEIFVVSNPVHADVVLPIVTEVIDWREFFPTSLFPSDVSGATHVAIGWGDRGFFLETPTWDDLKASTAAHALLWPSSTCLHVDFVTKSGIGSNHRSVSISTDQYTSLTKFIQTSFLRDAEGRPSLIEGVSYYDTDAFFEAHGTYHCFNTCNCWVGGALKAAGVRVPWFSPMPKTVFMYLP